MTRDERLLITTVRRNTAIMPTIRAMVPAFLLVRPLRLIADHPESTENEKSWGLPALDKLREACNAPLEPFNARGRKLIQGLVEDICRHAMQEATERRARKAMWAYLAVLYWTEQAIRDNPELLPENGPLHHAMYALWEAHQRHLDVAADVDKSARGGAKRLSIAFDAIELFPLGKAVNVAEAVPYSIAAE